MPRASLSEKFLFQVAFGLCGYGSLCENGWLIFFRVRAVSAPLEVNRSLCLGSSLCLGMSNLEFLHIPERAHPAASLEHRSLHALTQRLLAHYPEIFLATITSASP
jgi:hypothetical protein